MLKNTSGQALVENVLIIPVLVVIIAMLFLFTRIVLTKQQLVMASRYGTNMILYSALSKDQIKQELKDYLCGDKVEGRRLDPGKLIIRDQEIVINRIKKVTPINMWDDLDITPSNVQIFYEFDTPKLFYSWANYIGGRDMVKKLRIGARSEVLAGTGCKGDS